MIRKKARDFCVKDDRLYYKGDRLVVLSKEERTRVLNECHSSDTAGHFSIKKTVDKVKQRYYWPGQYCDIVKLVGYSAVLIK